MFFIDMNTLIKQTTTFFGAAVIPALFFALFFVLVGNNCDPKFGCAGTIGFIFKLSILPVAVISSVCVIATLLVISKLYKNNSIPKFWLLCLGVTISCFNLVTIKIAETYGFGAIISLIILATVVALFILSRINITRR